ncbi:phosphoribosylamine--glycine ligase, partial [Clostridium perfringens]
GKPKPIEFNARFGDPETQVVLPRLKTDLLDVFLAAVNGNLADLELEWSDEAAVCVILASGGYPASYPKGIALTGLENEQDGTIVVHAGASRDADGTWRTNGGRVLGVVGLWADIASARAKAYERAEAIAFEGKQNRTDIALKALV